MNEPCKLTYLQEIADQPMGIYMTIMVECPRELDTSGQMRLVDALKNEYMAKFFASLEEMRISLVFNCPCIGRMSRDLIVSFKDTKYYTVGMGKHLIDTLKESIAKKLFEY